METKWYNPTEKMPPIDPQAKQTSITVLGYLHGFMQVVYYDTTNDHWYFTNTDDLIATEVTHWCYLPNLPVVDNQPASTNYNEIQQIIPKPQPLEPYNSFSEAVEQIAVLSGLTIEQAHDRLVKYIQDTLGGATHWQTYANAIINTLQDGRIPANF